MTGAGGIISSTLLPASVSAVFIDLVVRGSNSDSENDHNDKNAIYSIWLSYVILDFFVKL